eukprot:446109_1
MSTKKKIKSLWIFVPSNTCETWNCSYGSRFLDFEDHHEMKISVDLGRSKLMDLTIPDKEKKIAKKHILMKEKKQRIHLMAFGTQPTYTSTFTNEPAIINNKTEVKLDNGAIVDLVQPNYCRFYLFNIIEYPPIETAYAIENSLSIGKRGNVYCLNVEKNKYYFDIKTCNPTVLCETIHKSSKGLPKNLCRLIIEMSWGDVMQEQNLVKQHICYIIGSNVRRRDCYILLLDGHGSRFNLMQPCDQSM